MGNSIYTIPVAKNFDIEDWEMISGINEFTSYIGLPPRVWCVYVTFSGASGGGSHKPWFVAMFANEKMAKDFKIPLVRNGKKTIKDFDIHKLAKLQEKHIDRGWDTQNTSE